MDGRSHGREPGPKELRPENFPRTWTARTDGLEKSSGRLRYLSDLSFAGMLFGKVLRSAHPHAAIRGIDVSAARKLAGVRAVLTHRDIPGMNRFGLVFPDQPVFCEDRARHLGDAIAAVAADSEDIAEEALSLIRVDYDPLPVIDHPLAALSPDAPLLHAGGNLLHRALHRRGDVEAGFAECCAVVSEVYHTPRQIHVSMETEGGVAVPGDDGRLTIYMGTQHGFRDRMQLARILAKPEDAIRVVSSPVGGSFGGKDELNTQPYAALLALATGRPVRIHPSRRESVRSSLRRHPMRITMKTGADQNGRVLAHEARIVADTGAYATLGPAVVDFAVEHSAGPYAIPNVDLEGLAVYTNNGVAGEFRGFGGNQATFALEGQMDRLAKALDMDPWEIRMRNLRHSTDPGPLGQRIAPTDGAREVHEGVRRSPLWSLRQNAKNGQETKDGQKEDRRTGSSPAVRTGIGMAIAMHGCGLGFGRPDSSGGKMALNREGEIELSFGFEEFGQGILTSVELMASEALGCAREDIRVTLGDTASVPASGSTTASRATSMAWQAIQRMRGPFGSRLLDRASARLGVPSERLRLGPGGVYLQLNTTQSEDLQSEGPRSEGPRSDATQRSHPQGTTAQGNGSHGSDPKAPVHGDGKTSVMERFKTSVAPGPLLTYPLLAKDGDPIQVYSGFHFPTTPDAILGAHFLYTFGSAVAQVEVDLLTGAVTVTGLHHSIAAGPVVNPSGYLGQIEGGGTMALGFALMEDLSMENGRFAAENLDAYLIPTAPDTPRDIRVEAVEALAAGDPHGPRGVGEIGTVAVAPAIASAIENAIGHFVSSLPVSPEEIQRACEPHLRDVVPWR